MGLRERAAQQAQKKHEPQQTQEVNNTLSRTQERQKAAEEQALEVYRQYQKNITLTERLQGELLKGLQAKEPIETLFLKAMQGLSLTTGNPILYTQARKNLKELYGVDTENS